MAVTYKMIPKKNVLVSPPEVNYYPCAVSQGDATLDDLAEMVAERSTMSKADCYGVIVGLTQVIGEALSEGKIVKLDHLGSLKITLQGTPSATLENSFKTRIKKVRLVYKPSSQLKKKLGLLTFKRI